MSPFRRKGRGGGSAKTMAPLPPELLSASPPKLPCKTIHERRALRSNPSLHLSSNKSHLTDKPHRILASSRSALDDSRLIPAPPARLDAHITAYLSDSGIGRDRFVKSVKNRREPEKIARIVASKATAIGLDRIRRASKEGGGRVPKDAGDGGAAAATKGLGKEASKGIPRKNAAETVRWSTTAIPSHINRNSTRGGGGAAGAPVAAKASSIDALKQRAKLSRRCVESMPEGSESGDGEELDSVEEENEDAGFSISARDKSCAAIVPANNLLSERYENASSSAIAAHYTPELSANSTAPSLPIVSAQALPNGISSFSSALHQRLALLEGKVTHIASELRKTKEMLDSNHSTCSLVLLSDIQGKISSIERAMTSRLGPTSPENAVMGDQFPRPSCLWSLPDPVDDAVQLQAHSVPRAEQQNPPFLHAATTGTFRLPSEQESLPSRLSLDSDASASLRATRVPLDQQGLEDRLFPHRKLLDSRLSLHQRPAESKDSQNINSGDDTLRSQRADLESQLHNAQFQDNPNSGDFLASLKQWPYMGREEEVSAGSTKLVVKQTDGNSDNSYHHGVILTENQKSGTMAAPGSQVSDYLRSAMHQNPHSGVAPQCPKQVEIAGVMNSFSSTDVQLSSGRSSWGEDQGRDVCAQGLNCAEDPNISLECDENLPSNEASGNQGSYLLADEFVEVDYDDFPTDILHPIGGRIATAGWYAYEGEAIVLAHDDGCCSYHDVANMEEKAEYEVSDGVATPTWNDCWLIRAAGQDGRSNKYFVAASAGTALDCGFCSWDFYSKDVVAYHSEYQNTSPNFYASAQSSPICPSSSRTRSSPSLALRCLPLSDGSGSKRSRVSRALANVGNNSARLYNYNNSTLSYQNGPPDSAQWWYRPCGPLMASAGSSLRSVVVYDIRDGDIVMRWNKDRPTMGLDYSSPLQWRDKGKLALAEEESISIWDVNAMDAQCLQCIELPEKRVSAFHMHNADAECSGGVRQRLSSSDTEGYDGLCCTQGDMNILDLRLPKGVGLRFPVAGQDFQSVYARGDMILTGSISKASNECEVQQWSVRQAKLVCTYAFPPSTSHYMHLSLTQVWGYSDMVMAVNGNGLYIFKGGKEAAEGRCIAELKDVIGTQDLFNPSFDYSNSRVLLISRDRPASWRYWPQ